MPTNMRLLHANTRQLKEFNGDEIIPPYAILSHTWGRTEDEVAHRDMSSPSASQIPGYSKINYCCEQAIQDGLEWTWVDT